MEQKKLTKGQLLRRLDNAILHIDKTKGTKTAYFNDKGLRLTVNEDYAIIGTLHHKHVFDFLTTSGVSRPYLYTSKLIDIANEHSDEICTESGYSFSKLLEVLKNKEDKVEYNVVTFSDWWIFNCFQPLYLIGETPQESFLVYEDYIHNIARQAVLLNEKTQDMTNKQFLDRVTKNIKEFTKEISEEVIFPKKTDEELMKENIEAASEQELNNEMEAQINESKD